MPVEPFGNNKGELTRVGPDSPIIGPPRVVYQDKYQQIYKVEADFGAFSKEYFVRDAAQKAGIVAVRGDSVLLVRQYRLQINGLSLEIPGGKINDGELPGEAAVRECLEETGVRCLNPRSLIFYHVGLDTTYSPSHIFISDQVSEEYEPQSIHQQEVSGFEWVLLSHCIEMIFDGGILDNFTIVGLLAHHALATKGAPTTLDIKCGPIS